MLTENLLYDAETGDPILTRTKNEFEDSVYNFTYPAHWAYTGMEPAYKNIWATFTGLKFTNGKITSSPYKNVESYFESGDEIMSNNDLYKISSSRNVNACTGESSCSSPVYSAYKIIKVWAIDASKIQNNRGLSGIYFVDANGKFYTSWRNYSTIVVVRSGKRNLATTSVGSVQSLSNPIRLVGGNYKLVFDDSDKIVNTLANKFSDSWLAENSKVSVVTSVTTKTKTNHTTYMKPISNLSMNWYQSDRGGNQGMGGGYLNMDFVEAETFTNATFYGHEDGIVATWLQFPLRDSIPQNSQITYASLSLWPHFDTHTVLPSTSGAEVKNHTSTDPFLVPGIQNQVAVGLETSSGILSNNWSTLTGSGNTIYQLNTFNNSTVDPTWTSTIGRTDKTNSYTIIDIAPQVAVGLNLSKFVLKFSPLHDLKTGNTNSARICYWARDTVSGLKSGGVYGTAPTLRVDYTYVPTGATTEVDCDTTYILTTSSNTNCISAITDTTVNPYVYGLLGNWRNQRSYVYYDNRKETDPTQPTDIRKNGTVTGFTPFWNFTSAKMSQTTDTTKWVWNTESTIFNKRGLELENHNALNIYNSAQYGYNESLPVAVTQNANYREQAYEGFEDYGFPNAQTTCNGCTVYHHMLVDSTPTNISTIVAHTGKYSLYVAPGKFSTAYGSISQATLPSYSLSVRIDSSQVNTYSYDTSGHGLADTVYYYGASNYWADTCGTDNPNYYNGGVSGSNIGVHNIGYDNNYNDTYNNPIGITQYSTNYKVVWQGYFLADSDFNSVTFNATASNSLKIWTGGFLNVNGFSNEPVQYVNLAMDPSLFYIHTKKGTIVPIRVEHTHGLGEGYANLQWKHTGSTTNWTYIPTKYLFPTLAAAQASIHNSLTMCRDSIGLMSSNSTLTEFSPKAGTQILVSAWVNETQNCHCNSYKHGNIQVVYLDSNGTSLGSGGMVTTYPSGNIIDGWQRIEGYSTVPSNAVKIQIIMGNDNTDNSNTPVYFDDLRIHPFNADMKSYIYDDVSLRLMAELDANNYATFYEYDDDGSLIRVKKETEQGIKTIKETRNALVRDIQ